MSTFKKGDRLRVVREPYYGSLPIGEIVTATADALGGAVDIQRSNGARGTWQVDRFEKVAYTVGQMVSGDDYDLLPVGSVVRMGEPSNPKWVKEESGWAFGGGKPVDLCPGDRRTVRVVVRVGPAPAESFTVKDKDGDWWTWDAKRNTWTNPVYGEIGIGFGDGLSKISRNHGIDADGTVIPAYKPLPRLSKGDRVRIIDNTYGDDQHNLRLQSVGVVESGPNGKGLYDVRGLHRNGEYRLAQWVSREDLRKTYSAPSKPAAETPRVTWQDPAPRTAATTRALGFTSSIFDEAPAPLTLSAQVRDLEAKVKQLEGDLKRERDSAKHWRTVADERNERLLSARRALR